MSAVRYRPWEPLVLLALVVVCIAIVALSPSEPVDALFGLPLALYLTGASLVAAVDPGHAQVAGVERQVWSVGSSLGLSVAGGLVLNVAGGLSRTSWLVWIAGVVLVCSAVSLLRRPPAPDTTSSLDGTASSPVPRNAPSAAVPDDAPRARRAHAVGRRKGPNRRAGVTLRQALLLVATVAVCAGALALSLHTNAATTWEPFVQGWVTTHPVDDVTSTSVQVGVRNHLGSEKTLLVHITVGGATEVFPITLSDGATWIRSLRREPGQSVQSVVTTSAEPSSVVSRVFLSGTAK